MTKKVIAPAAVAALSMAAATGAFAQAATQDLNITASVPKFCAVNGSATPTALSTTIPVSATGVVTTTTQNFTVNNVTCNTAADVVATSTGGGVKSSSAAPSGFTNVINYTGSATFGTATSTVNTATVPAAAGAESGNTAATSGATAGNLTITVTPTQPASPLIAGTDYSDVLRVTLTPQ
jgi:hypothetical protein